MSKDVFRIIKVNIKPWFARFSHCHTAKLSPEVPLICFRYEILISNNHDTENLIGDSTTTDIHVVHKSMSYFLTSCLVFGRQILGVGRDIVRIVCLLDKEIQFHCFLSRCGALLLLVSWPFFYGPDTRGWFCVSNKFGNLNIRYAP